MTRHLTRSRPVWALLAAVALLVAGLGAAARGASGTSAAWTDDVHTTTRVSLGTWSAALCEVRRDDDGAKVSDCQILLNAHTFEGGYGGQPITSLSAEIHVPGPGDVPGTHLYFSVRFPSGPGGDLPDADWTRAAVTAFYPFTSGIGLEGDCSRIAERRISGVIRGYNEYYDQINLTVDFTGQASSTCP